MWDTLLINAQVATMAGGDSPYGAIADGAVATLGNKIAWAGAMKGLQKAPADLAESVVDCAGRLITPSLVDCHTHLIFAGDRSGEFEARLKGASYEDIARDGGGIMATVTATREASQEDLVRQGVERAKTMMAGGVGVIEVKSGYGLDLESELKILRAATVVGENLPVKIVRTFLGAHTLPPEYKGNPNGYIDLLIKDILPALKEENLVDAVDAYQETIAFSAQEVNRLFAAAKALGIPVKLHADQLSDSDGAATAAHHKALSADHLEYTGEAGIKAMAEAGTTAVLLPGAFYTLKETQKPPVELLRKHKVPIAIASDCNPGTSPTTSLLLMMNMACVLFGLSPEEALAGVTRNAGRALGLADLGTISKGQAASLALWNVENPAALSTWMGANPLEGLILDGRPVIVSA